jgi:hypothetical protein
MACAISAKRVAEIESFFADNGEYPAVKIDKRFVGGMGSPPST